MPQADGYSLFRSKTAICWRGACGVEWCLSFCNLQLQLYFGCKISCNIALQLATATSTPKGVCLVALQTSCRIGNSRATRIWRTRCPRFAFALPTRLSVEGYILQRRDISIVRKTIRRAGAGRANADGSRARMCEATVAGVRPATARKGADRAARGRLAAVEGRMRGR